MPGGAGRRRACAAGVPCGIGTTLVEAAYLGRHGIGIEYEARWARLAAANIAYARRHGAAGNAEVIQGDARQLRGLLPPGTAGTAALIVTSPPYGPSIHGQVKAEARTGGGKVTMGHGTQRAAGQERGRASPAPKKHVNRANRSAPWS